METTSTSQLKTSQNAAQAERRGYAGFLEYTVVALDSLRTNKLRSFLTLLGITIGITSIISVISLINGMDIYWKTKVSNFGPNTFVVTQFPIITNFDKFIEALRRNPDVHAEDAETIRRRCPACEEVGVETHRNVIVRYGNSFRGVKVHLAEEHGAKGVAVVERAGERDDADLHDSTLAPSTEMAKFSITGLDSSVSAICRWTSSGSEPSTKYGFQP